MRKVNGIQIPFTNELDLSDRGNRQAAFNQCCQVVATALECDGVDRAQGLLMLCVDMLAPYGDCERKDAFEAFDKLADRLKQSFDERAEVYQMQEAEKKAAECFGYEHRQAN
jgi:hypothetical protein